MPQGAKGQAQPEAAHAQTIDPIVLPDVATQPHPAAPDELKAESNAQEAGEQLLQGVLPQINEVAKKVGGFKKLSEIADTLDEMGK